MRNAWKTELQEVLRIASVVLIALASYSKDGVEPTNKDSPSCIYN